MKRFPNQSPVHIVTGSKIRSQTILTHDNEGQSRLPLKETQPASVYLANYTLLGVCTTHGTAGPQPYLRASGHCCRTNNNNKGQAVKWSIIVEESLWYAFPHFNILLFKSDYLMLNFHHSYNLSFSRKPTVFIMFFLQRQYCVDLKTKKKNPKQ